MHPRPLVIAATTIVVSLLIGTTLAWPFVQDARVRGSARDHSWPEASARLEWDYRRLGRQPIADTCTTGARERVRLYVAGCMTEHLVEIDLGNGRTELTTGESGVFRAPDGSLAGASMQLAPARVRAIRALVAERLPSVRREDECCTMPAGTVGIDACIDGESLSAVRYSWDEQDPEFDPLVTGLREAIGLEFESSSPQVCL
jgi:hypothetical protein